MTASERRKIMCSVTFHVIAITCVVWSLYVLIDRTAEEIKQGQATGMSALRAARPGSWLAHWVSGVSATPGRFFESDLKCLGFWKGPPTVRQPSILFGCFSCCE